MVKDGVIQKNDTKNDSSGPGGFKVSQIEICVQLILSLTNRKHLTTLVPNLYFISMKCKKW
jgi:hypothetical protein